MAIRKSSRSRSRSVTSERSSKSRSRSPTRSRSASRHQSSRSRSTSSRRSERDQKPEIKLESQVEVKHEEIVQENKPLENLQENGRKSKTKSRSRSRSESDRSRSRSRRRGRDSRKRRHSSSSRSRSYSRSRSHRRSRSGRRNRRSHRGSKRSHSRTRSPSPYYRRQNPSPCRVLGVFGLNFQSDERDLKKVFEKYGRLDKIKLVTDPRTGRSRGFAFIYYENVDDAEEAKEKIHGQEIDGNRVRVEYSISNREHHPTPGIYMGRRAPPKYDEKRRGRRSDSRSRSRSRSRSYERRKRSYSRDY